MGMFLIGIGFGFGWCSVIWLNYELKKSSPNSYYKNKCEDKK